MLAADPPGAIATAPAAKAPDVVVVRRDTRSDVLAGRDTPLALIKAGKTEDATLRQAIFLTSTLTVVRPALGGGEETLRWTYEAYLQRQFCLTSMTGQFSCAAAEVETLTERAAGEAPLAPTPGPNPAAEAARTAVVGALRTQAAALFEDDRRLKFNPVLKAAGVSIRRAPVSVGAARR